MESYDVVIIGGGSAGYAAARTARETSEKVAIVDNSAELGGLCILRGCMPSKTLIYSAEVLHLARDDEIGARLLEGRHRIVDVLDEHGQRVGRVGADDLCRVG